MHRTWLSRSRGLLLAAVVSLGRVATASADDATAGSPGEWLARFTSARTLGLGSAYVATANDPLGVFWNPAGLSWMDQNELRFETARLFEDTSINSPGLRARQLAAELRPHHGVARLERLPEDGTS
jgi:hypothetical protein